MLNLFRVLKKKSAFLLFFFFFLSQLHLWHTDIPRLGVKSELQLTAYTTACANDGSLTH